MSKNKIIIGSIILIIIASLFYINSIKLNRTNNKTIESAVVSLPEISIAGTPASVPQLIIQTITNQKLDQKYGYILKLVSVQPPNMVTSLFTNNAQLITLAPSEVIELNKNGKNIKMFSFMSKTFCPFITKDSFKNTTENSLKGKKVAIVKKPSAAYGVLDSLMKKKSQSLTNYFKITEVDLLSLPILLEKGEVDASNICNIISTAKLLSQNNQYKIVDSTENMINKQFNTVNSLPFLGVVAQNQWIENNYNLSKAFDSSLIDALNYIQNNIDNEYFYQELTQNFKLNDGQIITLRSLIKDNNYFNPINWQEGVKQVEEFTQTDFDPSSFIELK